jgi:hypothetical protein
MVKIQIFKEIHFLRIDGYDNSRAVNFWQPEMYDCSNPEEDQPKGVWCWAVRGEDKNSFFTVYEDCEIVEVFPSTDSRMYVIDFEALDGYVTGKWDEPPDIEDEYWVKREFDPDEHCVRKGGGLSLFSFDDEYDDNLPEKPYFVTPYAIWFTDD